MDTFSSDILLKKVGSLQEQNDALSAESERLKRTAEHTRLKSKRLTFLIDKTVNANLLLRRTVFGAAAFSVIALVVAGVVFARTASLVGANRGLTAQVAALENDLTRLKRQQTAMEEKFEAERLKLVSAAETAKKESEELRYELEKARLGVDSVREEKVYLEDILIHKTREIEKLKASVSGDQNLREIKAREEEIARLSEQNRLLGSKLEGLYKTTADRLAAIALAKATLEETIAEAKKRVDAEWNAVDLGRIAVERGQKSPARAESPRAASQAAPAAAESPRRSARTEGRVRAVNEAHGFVVVDMGKVDNLSEDSVLQIKKGGEWLATLTVLEVRDVMAACNVKNAVPGYRIRVDDPVFIQQR